MPGVGEFELIQRFFVRAPAKRVELGIGDDCALLAPLHPASSIAVSTDMLVSGRHFFADAAPRSIGHKSLAVNLSDLAAMGAKPRAFTLAISLPAVDEHWLAEFAAGLFALADAHDCELIGGDTTKGPLNICITVFGDCDPQTAMRRDKAEPDDDIWVSGELGAASYSVKQRYAGQALPADHPGTIRAEWPQPRVGLGLELRHIAKAAIDLSDGLVGDLGHVADRSRVGAQIVWPSVPVASSLIKLEASMQQALALGGGDDYELLFTAAPQNRDAISSLSQRLNLRLSLIGRIVVGSGIAVVDAKGKPIHANVRSFDHFA